MGMAEESKNRTSKGAIGVILETWLLQESVLFL